MAKTDFLDAPPKKEGVPYTILDPKSKDRYGAKIKTKDGHYISVQSSIQSSSIFASVST